MLKYNYFHEGEKNMDFGKFDDWKLGERDGRAPAYISSDILVYRRNGRSSVQVLVGNRQNEPWKNSTTVPMGGYVDDNDVNLLTASLREVEEETGLKIEVEFFVGIYGPERYNYDFVNDGESMLAAKTGEKGHVRPVVSSVFAGKVIGGKLKDTAEQKDLRWEYPDRLGGTSMPCDHALALVDFLRAIDDGSAKTWRREALQLVK